MAAKLETSNYPDQPAMALGLLDVIFGAGPSSVALSAAISTAIFNPLDLETKLKAWWTARRADLITVSGSDVSSWADVVGGYALTQSTPASRPAYSPTAFNNRPGLVFDGTADCLESSDAGLMAAIPTGSTPGEIWVVCRNDALVGDGVARRAVAYGGNSNNTSRSVRRLSDNTAQGTVGTGSASADESNGLADFYQRRVVRLVANGSTVITYVDGHDDRGSVVPCVPSTGTTRFRAGAASTDGAAGFWKGVITDIFITSLLTDREAAKLWSYCVGQSAKDADGIPDEIWVDGDSYSTVVGDDSLARRFNAAGRLAIAAGIGGTTLAAQRARIESRIWSTSNILIHWDGNSNGHASLDEDMAHYAAIVAAVPRSVILTPVRRGVDDSSMRAYISTLQTALLAAYPTRALNLQPILAAAATSPGDDADVAANVVPRSLLIDHVSDSHLNAAGWNVVYPHVQAMIDSLGW